MSLASLLCLFFVVTPPPSSSFKSFCYFSASPSDNIYVNPNSSQSFFLATSLNVSRLREGSQEEYFCHCLRRADTLVIQHFLSKSHMTPWKIALPTVLMSTMSMWRSNGKFVSKHMYESTQGWASCECFLTSLTWGAWARTQVSCPEFDPKGRKLSTRTWIHVALIFHIIWC